MFTLPNKIGALDHVLSVFSLNDINLCHIESRPLRPADRSHSGADHDLFHYRFTVECSMNVHDPVGKRCMETLALHTENLVCLGSYPADNTRYRDTSPLRVGILGFGPFGRYLATKLAPLTRLSAWSRSDYSKEAGQLGIPFTTCLEDYIAFGDFDVLVVCVSMEALDPFLARLVPLMEQRHLAHPDDSLPLIADVLSVKSHPARLFQNYFNTDNGLDGVDLLLTHPMFGPESCPGTVWTDAPLVYHPLRIGSLDRMNRFLDLFRECKWIPMPPEEHDYLAAKSQFVAHTFGQIVKRFGLEKSRIDTNSFQHLLALKAIVGSDSKALFNGLYRYNSEAPRILETMERHIADISEELRCGVATRTPLS